MISIAPSVIIIVIMVVVAPRQSQDQGRQAEFRKLCKHGHLLGARVSRSRQLLTTMCCRCLNALEKIFLFSRRFPAPATLFAIDPRLGLVPHVVVISDDLGGVWNIYRVGLAILAGRKRIGQ